MQRQKIDIVCGQEGRRPTSALQRWDSNELLICGKPDPPTAGNNRQKDGNFFILNEAWTSAWMQGGKQVQRLGPRLITIRIPLKGGLHLYLINAHAYDKRPGNEASRRAFDRRLHLALSRKKHDDIMVLAGDFNASLGVAAAGTRDSVRGNHGIAHVDLPGRELAATAALHGLVDLTSQQPQHMPATFFDHRSQLPKQLDRIFVDSRHLPLVNKCVIASMIVDSDHESVRLNIQLRKPPPPPAHGT
jgi:exonuclease III